MQQKKEKLAILIDEYGGVSGMVTLEDLRCRCVTCYRSHWLSRRILIESSLIHSISLGICCAGLVEIVRL